MAGANPNIQKIKHTERSVDGTEEIRPKITKAVEGYSQREIVMNMLIEGHRRKPNGMVCT